MYKEYLSKQVQEQKEYKNSEMHNHALEINPCNHLQIN